MSAQPPAASGAPETRITFTFEEIVQALLRSRGIDEGTWTLFVEFGIGAVNVQVPNRHLAPTALVPVTAIGIQRGRPVEGLSAVAPGDSASRAST